ncbi:vacuolar protein sorting-associated protein 13A [Rhincodon typus]|uniref:vacuolar protein sorting-associated protein 13A n=1 Tax=Rhincodon typus TaxID=259920 RepID=UPI00202F82B5|nr:vacuolar protein sorting-associated protein 13A [Rhincodon typus]
MVFESLVVEVLNRFLGDYVVNLDTSQLQLGIWGGDVVLNNLEVKENALSELNVPFKVKAGHVSKLELKIPWKNLYGQAVEATLDGIYMLIVPCASIKYDAEKEELQLQEIKQRELQRIEEAKQKVADKENPKEGKQDTFLEKLITQVIKNLQVKITNVHIRYEDDITNQNSPLSFGISLENLSLETTDERWNPCLHDQCEHVFNKLVRLDYLCAYWNVNTKMYSKSHQVQALKDLKNGVSRRSFIPETYQFIFQPLSAQAKLEMNPRAEVDFASPKMNLEVNLEDIAIEINRPQYLSIMELLGSIDMMTRNLPYRKYRPDVPCHNNARKWWAYAINGILEENIKPALNAWSWRHIRKHRQKLRNYRSLYKSRIKTKKPDEELISTLEELEKDLDLFNITLARQQAEVEVMKTGHKIYRPGAKIEDEKTGGWFDWAWSWAGAKEEKPRDSKSGIDLLMTPEEKAKLYAAIGYSETVVDPTMPKRYEAVKLAVKLVSMSVSIREEDDQPEIMKFAVIDLSMMLTQRPGAQAIKFEAKISTLEVTGLPQNTDKPLLLSSRSALTENEEVLLRIMFETNPLDERADQRLKAESRPLEIVYDARTVNGLVDFFRPPTDVQLVELTSATLMKLEEFRDKTATGLMYIIETQKVLDLKVNLMASYVIIPQNGFFDKSASLLVLDLGNLKMMSKSRARLPQITAGESTLEDIMARAYDCFDIQLSSVQLLYAKPHEDWKTARKEKKSSQHILQPMDLKLELCRAMVVSDPRMPKFKIYGGLALLSVCISDQKLRRVLELIDSIPKPRSNSPPPSLKSRQTQKVSPNMTPRSVQKRAVHKDLYSSVLSMADSDDEFYDAPSSPVDEAPFLPAKAISLQRSESIRQKQLRKQESMKNMTDFQMQFEISKMSLGICRYVEDTEAPVLELEIAGLGTELKIRTYDMTSRTFLKEISLKCPEQTDAEDKPIYIITTLDNCEDDLLTIEYIKANKDGPEFKTTYRNTEQLIKVNFSSLDVYLHSEALLSSVHFLKNLIPQSETKVSSDEQVPEIEEKKEEILMKKKTSPRRGKFEDLIKLHLCAELALLKVFICDQSKRIAEISIVGLDVEVALRKTLSEVTAKLKNIVVLDSSKDAVYKKAVSIAGKEVFNFKIISHVDATEGLAYSNMDVVDSCVQLTVGCIQVIFVKKFLSSVLAFLNVFQAAREAVTEATVQAASGVKDLAERSTRMQLDIHINAPVVVVPQSPVSKNVVVADFGFVIIQNSFSMIKQKGSTDLPPIIDSMKVSLRELKLYSCRSDLRLQLIVEDKKMYAPCEAITFGHVSTSTEILFHRKCQLSSDDDQHTLMINIVAMHDMLASDNRDENNNAYVLHLWPSAILQNLLPCAVSVSLTEENKSRRLTLDEGHSAQLHDAVLDQSKLTLTIIDYLEHNWAGEYSIKSNQTDIELIKFKSYIDGEETEIDIAVLATYNVGHVLLSLYSPYWMINKTGRMLQYKADDVHRKHPLDYKKPLLFSFGSKCFFEKNKVQLRITDSQLSDSFSLDTVGSYGSVKCKGPKKEYQVGVKIDNSSFNLTRIVTFTPFHMLINQTKHKIEVVEECESKWLSIDSNQCSPFWPARDSERLAVRIEGCSAGPQKVYFNKQENCLLLRLDNKFGGIIVEVHLAEHSLVVTFKDYHEGAAPFLIINDTNASRIEYHQSSSTGKGHQLEPGKATYYTWEDPTVSRTLSWNCSCQDAAGELSTIEDIFLEFPQENGKIYLASFFEGLQRIIVFTDDEGTFRLTQENETAEQAEQEIILSLQNLGISLINNSTKQEVVYIGITSSDIVWESKPKVKSRWKPMSRKQTAELEEIYKEYIESSPQENHVAELPCEFQALLTPNGVDMKLLQPSEVPIRRNYLPAIKVEYTVSTHQKSLRVQIYKIQIQNQLPGAIFPFPFYPIIPPKSVTMDSAPKPFADVSIITRFAGKSDITRFRYFKVLIQEMDLKLDLGFLYAVMDLFTQSTDTVLAEQKLDLFKKDLEYIQTELLTESAVDTTPVSLYEHFHISPIKLHLSFSISSGGEESNKQQEADLIPLQSLNLLLKSIGATLTDVQDVVFKLAFFEINYQFYTTQQLQWEVIRHYSKQAIKQLYVLVFGLDVLGNPFGLIRDLSQGVEAFFYEPYQGAIQGPEEFMEGMALGVKALVGGAVGGIAGAASRITGAMAKGVAAMTMDEEYQQRRREAMNRQPSGIKEGITRGGKGLVSGFVSGITGIVTKPIKGAQKEGAAGFFKGIGKGLVGAVARPTGGIIDLASSTFQGIKRATETTEDVESLRPPRFIHEDGVIRPYRLREGIGMQMLQKIENGRFAKYKYFGHKMINDSDLFMITKSGILFVTQGTFGQLNCEWQYSFEEFTKEPFIVAGRRLRIEAKERVKSVFHAKEYGKIVNFKTEDDAQWILAKLHEVRERRVPDHHPKI